MKKTIIAILVVAAGVIACSPKASKVTRANIEAGGALISSAKCTKCHTDKTNHVAKFTFADQEKLFINMAGKAKLSWAETQDLMAFVKKNALK